MINIDKDLNSRGLSIMDEMIAALSGRDKPNCEACKRQSGFGRWEEEHGTDRMPINKATCIVWIRDPRVMIDFSHLEFSCEYHTDFYPYPKMVDYGNGPRINEDGSIRVIRQIVWPPQG